MKPIDFEMECEGEIYRATYVIENDLLTLSTDYGEKSTRIKEEEEPENLTRILLGRLIREGKAVPENEKGKPKNNQYLSIPTGQ